jgi:hypothetical protein
VREVLVVKVADAFRRFWQICLLRTLFHRSFSTCCMFKEEMGVRYRSRPLADHLLAVTLCGLDLYIKYRTAAPASPTPLSLPFREEARPLPAVYEQRVERPPCRQQISIQSRPITGTRAHSRDHIRYGITLTLISQRVDEGASKAHLSPTGALLTTASRIVCWSGSVHGACVGPHHYLLR